MILWSVRNEGSPISNDGLTADDVIDGIKEGLWEPTDEIMGPDDPDWVAIDQHPIFAQAMADYEPPLPKEPVDETRLDMNPLIDVALVLLIFFMLTTTYDVLRKEFRPEVSREKKDRGMTESDLKKSTVFCSVRMEGDKPVYRVENEVVAEEGLEAKLKEVRERKAVNELAIDVDPEVPWEAQIRINDAAAGAKFAQILQVVRPER